MRLNCSFILLWLRVPICIVEKQVSSLPAGTSGQVGKRELESTNAFSKERQGSSSKKLNKALQSKKHKIQVTEPHGPRCDPQGERVGE